MFLLPDGDAGLEFIDDVPTCIEAVLAMCARNCDTYGGFANVERSNTMHRSNSDDWPAFVCLLNDGTDLLGCNFAVRFVLEAAHVGSARRMIPYQPAEHDRAAGGRVCYESSEEFDVDRSCRHINENGIAACYGIFLHTLTIMQEDTPESTPSESHVPFTTNRNDDETSGVETDMDPTEPPAPDTADSTTPEPYASPVISEPTAGLPDPPFVPFVYDDPEQSVTQEVRPEPVSARIKSEPQKRGSRTTLFFAGSAVAGILGALLTLGVLAATGTFDEVEAAAPPTTIVNAEPAGQTVEVAPPQIINDLGAAVNPTAVAAKALASVVTVTVFNAPVDENSPPVGVGSGSGVVISTEGYIITNHHVIENADTFSVTFEDDRVYEATLIGSDELTDLAVLQIEASELTPIEFGSTDSLRVGDPAVAIGNPLAQDGGASVTVGIISAFDRRVDFADNSFLHGMIQTDAAINSGSSGGALLDVDGNLIGITSAIGVSQAGPEGIGYAIPIELVDRITAEIIETGDVAHPFLGVQISTQVDEAPDGAIVPSGALIETIEGTDSAAGMAGLLPGDVITMIGDKPIVDQTDLILAVRLYRVGDEVEFVAIRDGESMSFSVVMGQRPAEFKG